MMSERSAIYSSTCHSWKVEMFLMLRYLSVNHICIDFFVSQKTEFAFDINVSIVALSPFIAEYQLDGWESYLFALICSNMRRWLDEIQFWFLAEDQERLQGVKEISQSDRNCTTLQANNVFLVNGHSWLWLNIEHAQVIEHNSDKCFTCICELDDVCCIHSCGIRWCFRNTPENDVQHWAMGYANTKGLILSFC